ncbi:MAG: hypothetical protein LBT19_00245 [Candidatus Nomurabacteria bacterium]|nr:hypothetical protein [Candidatus Nomurabacteria bacterium]
MSVVFPESVELKNLFLVVVAGGQGTRLFPMSHDLCPKQFCMLDSKQTFIQATVRRFVDLGVKASRVVVVTTNANQTKLANEQLSSLGVLVQNVYEIKPHFDYAGAMVKAAQFIYDKFNKDAVVINTPADQYVVSDEKFSAAVVSTVKSAQAGYPTLIGVKITDPNLMVGCGHVVYDADDDAECKTMLEFVEKPGREKADYLMREDVSVCNTGINAWPVKRFLDMTAGVRMSNGLKTDVLMRLLSDVRVVIGGFDWYDCGTLKSLYDISDKTPNHKNASLGQGEIHRHNCRGSLFVSIRHVEIHAAGAENVAVVVNEVNGRMVIVVVNLDDSQKVRDLADDYQKYKAFLTDDFSVGARNNRVSTTRVSEDIRVGFVGVRDYTITAVKYDDGRFVVIVSNDSVQAIVA